MGPLNVKLLLQLPHWLQLQGRNMFFFILLQTFASSLCATHSLLLLFCAVRRLAGHVDDLECFYHLFLPGGWRSVQGKEQKNTFSWINSASVSN